MLVLASLSIRLRAVGNEVVNEAMYQAVQSKYDVPVVLKEPSFPVRISTGTIDGKEARRESVQDYGKLFAEEFSLYPVEFVRRTGLQRIVLAKSFRSQGSCVRRCLILRIIRFTWMWLAGQLTRPTCEPSCTMSSFILWITPMMAKSIAMLTGLP